MIHSPAVVEVFQIQSLAAGLPAGPLEVVTALDDARALAVWLDSCRRFKSPHTVRAYEREALRFRMWMEWYRQEDSPRLLASVRAADVGRYLDHLGNPTPFPDWLLARYARTKQPFDGPLAASSVRQALVILSTMYERFREVEDLNRQPYVLFNPFTLVRGSVNKASQSVSAMPDILPPTKVLPLAVWRLVEDYLDARIAERPQDPSAHRDRWVVKLLYLSWFRRHEVASIKMGSFSNQSGNWKLYVVGKGSKREWIVATTDLMDALRDYREFNKLPPYPLPGENRPAIIPLRGDKHVTGQTVYRIFKECLNAVATSVEADNPEVALILRAAGPHWLRHSGITHSADAGLDVKYASKQARHTDIRTTVKNYYAPDDSIMREQLENAGKTTRK